MINNLQEEFEEYKKTYKEYDSQQIYSNKTNSRKFKSKKIFPSEDENYGGNIISLNLSTDLSLFKKIAEATVEEFDTFNSEEDSINKQIESKKKESKRLKDSEISKNSSSLRERKDSISDGIYSDKSSNSKKKEKIELINSSEENSNGINLNFLNLNSKHESINIITDRIVHEVYLDLSLNTNPFVDYILYERQVKFLTNKN